MTFAVRKQNCLCPLADEMEVSLNRVLRQEQVFRDVVCFTLLLARVFSKCSRLSVLRLLVPLTNYFLFLYFSSDSFLYIFFATVCLIQWICFSFLYKLLEPQHLIAKCSIFWTTVFDFYFKNLMTSKLVFWTLELLIRNYFSEVYLYSFTVPS